MIGHGCNTRSRSRVSLELPTALEQRTLLSGTPMGSALQVSYNFTENPGHEANSVVAMDSDGDMVVAWQQYGLDGDGAAVALRKINPDGTSWNTIVNTSVWGIQNNPAIAMASSGGFVVVWQSDSLTGANGFDIHAQRFDPNGNFVGTELQVNSFTAGDQIRPVVAMDADGDFVIAWRSDGQDAGTDGIYVRRFSSNGTSLGSEFKVNMTTLDSQDSNPAVAANSKGEFILAWENQGDVYYRRYKESGSPHTNELSVGSRNAGTMRSNPKVGLQDNGIHFLAWESSFSDAAGEFSTAISLKVFDSQGNSILPQASNGVAWSLESGPLHTLASVSMNSTGDALIAWNAYQSDHFEIRAMRFNFSNEQYLATLGVIGAPSTVPVSPGFEGESPSLVMGRDGDFAVSYTRDPIGETGEPHIFVQRYRANWSEVPGVWRTSKFYIDSNQSRTWNGPTVDALTTFGIGTDTPVAGDWDGDGFSDIGVWRNGTFYLDFNGNGVWDGSTTDRQFSFGLSTDKPLIGDWNGDFKSDVGVWRSGKFYLDLNGNRKWDSGADGAFTFGSATDTPLIGDWNGDGFDDIGVWRAGKFYLDMNENRLWNSGVDTVFTFGSATDTPLAGDWNGNRMDDIGVWRAGKFYMDSNGNHLWEPGADRIVSFGSATDKPLLGHWRPKPQSSLPLTVMISRNGDSEFKAIQPPLTNTAKTDVLAGLMATSVDSRKKSGINRTGIDIDSWSAATEGDRVESSFFVLNG